MIKKKIKNTLNKNFSPQTVNNIFLIWLLFKKIFKSKKNRSIMDVFNKKKYFVTLNSKIVFFWDGKLHIIFCSRIFSIKARASRGGTAFPTCLY